MHKTRKRTLILSLASATAGFALPGCGDSSETNTTTADAGHEAAQIPGVVIMPVGSVIAPPRDASDESTPIITGSFVAPPDAGDAGDSDPGVVVHPTDASDARPFPGVVINPQDGSASG
jgi:hypothetical protein